MAARWIEYLPLDELVPAPRNPKGHDLDGISASLDRFGLIEVAAVMDERTGRLIGGHGRTEVLALAHAAGVAPPDGIDTTDDGRWLVPVFRGWSSRSDTDAAAALVGVNELVTRGGWRTDELASLLTDLAADPLGLTGTGYDDGDLARLLDSLATTTVHEHQRALPGDDGEPLTVPEDPLTQRGDVWLLGRHRLMCGDSRDPADVATLLDGATINVAFTSPPYADRRTYDKISGFVPIHPDEYVDWFQPIAANVADHLAADGSWFVNIKEHADDGARLLYVKDLTLAHAREWGWQLVDEFCWDRSGMPGWFPNRFRNEWEPVFHFAKDPLRIKIRHANVQVPSVNAFRYSPATHISLQADRGYVESGTKPERTEGLANPGNIIRIGGGADAGDGGHTAAFPSALPAWFIRAFTDPDDRVYDPFSGSGTTILAAEHETRQGYGMELSPGYVDATLARWQRHTGQQPILASTSQPHDFTPQDT